MKLAQKKMAPRGIALAHAEAETGSEVEGDSCSSCSCEDAEEEEVLLPGTTGKRCDHHPFFFLLAK